MQNCHSVLVGLFLLLLTDKPSTIIASCQHQKCDQTVGPTKFVELVNFDSDFENGQIDPWIEQSESGVKWRVENKILPWEPENVAPTPPNGSNYLRVNRGAALSFGVAVLRSQTFSLGSDTEVSFSFSFWIRSKWPQFTNLELYLAKNGNEALLLNLYEYSHINNRVWQSQTVSLTDETSSNLTLVFYAYCGTNAEDAVAIDDLRFISSQQSASTTSITWTTPTETSSWTTATSVTSSTRTTFTTSSSFETESTTYPSTTSTGTTLSTTPTTSTSSDDFELTENATDPISTSTINTELPETSTPSTEIAETSPPPITTTSTTPLPTTSEQTTTDITEETTTEEQSTRITSSSQGSTESTESTESATTSPEEEDCPSYLEGNTKMPCWTLGGKCYCFFTDAIGKNWISADLFCKDKGMGLLSLETVEEDKLIYDHIKITPELNSVSYWTSGMYSLDGDKIWEWAYTEPFQPFTYVNWSPGQPDNNGPGYCLHLDLIKTFSGGYWADIFCTNSFRFICESIN